MRNINTIFVVAVALLAAITTTAASATVRLAHRWNTENAFHLGLVAGVEGFEARYPEIQVQLDYGYGDDKYKVEIAAGAPADVVFVFPPISWAANGFIQPLDKYVERSKIVAKDFVPASWHQNIWDGKLWALPLQVDPNFALVWNKTIFATAGIDASRGPVTLHDYDALIRKLTFHDANDQPKQVGAVPWSVYGNANTIYTWGWIFGGEFYDYQAKRITATDSRIVASLEYLRDHWSRLNTDVSALGQGLPTGRSTFSAGRIAMQFFVTGDLFTMVKTCPDVEVGVGKMPYKVDTGLENPAWIGGWSLSMAKGAKNPEEGWKLIEYLTASPEGTALFAGASKWLPGYLRSPALRDFATDPYWRVYADIAMTTVKFRPAIPQQGDYYAELDRILPLTLNGTRMPLDALEEVTRIVEAKIEEAEKRQ